MAAADRYGSRLDIYAHYHRRVAATLNRLSLQGFLPQDLDLGRFAAAPPVGSSAAEIVVDAALVYGPAAVSLGRDPHDLARVIACDLAMAPMSATVDISGPYFVNVTLRPAAILKGVSSVLRGPAGRTPGRAGPSGRSGELSGSSLTEIRGRVAAEQAAALLAALGRPPPVTGPDGRAPGPVGPVSVRRRDPAASRGCIPLAGLTADAFRLAVASRRPDATLQLDLPAMSDRSRHNPAFWIPYAHARLCGAVRHAAVALPDMDLAPSALAEADLSGLTNPGEIALAGLVIRNGHVVASAAASGSARRLAAFLAALAAAVHSQWNRSKDQPQLRFVNEEERALTKARLGLATASLLVLKSGLGILGVDAPDEMR